MEEKTKKTKRGKTKVHDSSKYIELEPNMNEESDDIEELDEVRQPLTIAQRRKRGMVMRRFKTKIAAARKRAKKRKASPEKLKMRARKKARNIIRQRLMKNKSYSEMTPAEKIALDKRVAKISPVAIDRIATRQLPQIRQAEVKRLSSAGKPKTESINERFEMLFERSAPQDSDISDREGTQPKKYFSGLAKSTKEKRDTHFKKGAEKSTDDSSAYKPAPGDSEAKTKPSNYTKRYHQMFTKENKVKIDRRFKRFKDKKLNESAEDFIEDSYALMESVESLFENSDKALKNKAEETGISYGILKKVYDRGMAAWRTGHRPGTTPEQWGMARVNSFATGGKTRTTADADLWAKHSGKNESFRLFGEEIDFNQLDEETLMDKVLNAMHKHVTKGVDIGDIAWEISGAAGVNMSSRELIKKYAERFGKTDKPKLSDARVSALRKKYGFSEGKEDPNNREEGTDSLVKIYKKDTPLQEVALNADVRRGDRVKFTRIAVTDPQEDIEGTFVGTDEATGRMRIREDDGKLHIVKHQDVSKIGGVNESFSKAFGVQTQRKSLREFMVNIPKKKDTLGIKREDMPQVSSKDMDDFRKYLKDNNVNIQKITVDPKSLKASQGEFSKDKIETQIDLMSKSKEPLKAIIISADDYVIDGHHRWLAAMNLGIKMPVLRATMKAKQLIELINKYPKVKNVGIKESYLYETFDVISENDETCPIITMGQMRQFETLVDKLFEKFGVNFDFTKHFRERMSDERNKPCINLRELAQMIQKIYNKNKADGKTLSKFTDTEAVIKDLQSNLNMPIAVEYDRRNDELRVVAKTIMRKKDFKTPNPIVRV